MLSALFTSLFVQLLCFYHIVRSQEYLGCYVDTSLRMLGHSTTFNGLTSAMCIDYCYRLRYKYAGLQARTKCFCGEETPANFKTSETACNMECPGNKTEKCGGTLRSSVYKINNPKKAYDYLGCYKDQVTPRALSGFHNNFNILTPSECIELCKGLGYLYAGLQFGSYCYCGNELPLSNERIDRECTSNCGGDLQKKCGAFLRNSIYLTGAFSGPSIDYGGKSCAQPSAPLNAVKSCSSETCTITCLDDYAFPDGSTTVSISCINGSWKPNRSGWSSVPGCKVKASQYLGCYIETTSRILGHYNTFTALTSEMCIDYCQKLGYTLAGLQARTYCFCGFEAPDKQKTSESACNLQCPGNEAEKCGGVRRISIYKIMNPKKAYEYLGCYKDQESTNALTGFYRNIYDMTPFQCLTLCKTLGYVYAGLQSGSWCYCGNELQPIYLRTGESGCQSRCTGNSHEMCGGVNTNSLYFTGLCTSPCQNGGTCLSNNSCSCPSNFYGTTCENKYCVGYPPTPANSAKSCYSGKCTITCFDNYKLPDGSAKADILCKDGEWVPAVADCKAICTSPCQNGGTCVSPNTCACPRDFFGPTCQRKGCVGYPITSANARTLCDSEKCTVTCLENYAFSDGTTTDSISCNDGKWGTAKGDCKAICSSPCQNGGTCVSPNTCACPENFYGPSCERKRCIGYPPTPANSTKSCGSEMCTITCLENYSFSDGSTTDSISCNGGIWGTAKGDCKAICTTPCQNGGICTSPNTCTCPENFYGPYCEEARCVEDPPVQPANSNQYCDNEGCTITCWESYAFADGSTTDYITCSGGIWSSAKSSCEAICTTPCQNGGICTSPNTCACPENFYGTYCEETRCVGDPPAPANSNQYCDIAGCTITCWESYAFTDGSTTDYITCTGGTWSSPKSGCEAICTYPCQNGGTCISSNTCACTEHYYGPTCESISCTGNIPTSANSNQYCDFNTCTITCLENYSFSDGTTTEYVSCNGGVWGTPRGDCEAICNNPCQNGGTCVSPNNCACPGNFYGPSCEGTLCVGEVPAPLNSNQFCDYEKCTIICLENYAFSDGSTTVDILCNDGIWGTVTSDCEAICTSPCQNGGTCISPNTCACPENFYGPTCEE